MLPHMKKKTGMWCFGHLNTKIHFLEMLFSAGVQCLINIFQFLRT